MARKDVILRFAQVENEYLEMLDLLKELNEDVQAGKIPLDYYNDKTELISEEVETIKTQYFFWAEAIFELNKPNKHGKKMDATTEQWYKELRTSTKEALKDDSKNALETLIKIIKEGKK